MVQVKEGRIWIWKFKQRLVDNNWMIAEEERVVRVECGKGVVVNRGKQRYCSVGCALKKIPASLKKMPSPKKKSQRFSLKKIPSTQFSWTQLRVVVVVPLPLWPK
jgi:hypothetical protein